MRHYENLIIVKPTLTEEEIQSSINAIEEIITSNGGTIAARNAMGMRKLAYPIEKNIRGYFQVIYYTIAPSSIREIERRFRINEELLRFVTIKYENQREIKAWESAVKKQNNLDQVKSEPEAKDETVKTDEPTTSQAKEEAVSTEENAQS